MSSFTMRVMFHRVKGKQVLYLAHIYEYCLEKQSEKNILLLVYALYNICFTFIFQYPEVRLNIISNLDCVNQGMSQVQ